MASLKQPDGIPTAGVAKASVKPAMLNNTTGSAAL